MSVCIKQPERSLTVTNPSEGLAHFWDSQTLLHKGDNLPSRD